MISLGRALDSALPAGGLLRGALHEAAGTGPETEHAAAATLFVAACLAAGTDPVLWVLLRSDMHGPALAGVGLHPDRVIYAEAPRPAQVLIAMEDALRHRGLAAVVGEYAGALTLTASRRLQLAAESTGTPAILLRRSRRFDDPAIAAPSAALTRWRVTSVPSAPPVPDAPDIPGLGAMRWRVDLVRARGGVPASWILEVADATGRLSVPADVADRSAAPGRRRAA